MTVAALAGPARAQDPKVGAGSGLAAALATKAGTVVKLEFKIERDTPIYEFDVHAADGPQQDIRV